MTQARQDLLVQVVGGRRNLAAAREHERYTSFCETHRTSQSTEATVLYLTWLLSTGEVHGRGLRYRLHLLDLHARIQGVPPPSHDLDLRRYLRGLHREASLALPEKGTDPLYSELLAAVVEEIARPEPQQLHDLALLLLAHATGLTCTALAALRWDQLKLVPGGVVVTTPAPPRRGRRWPGKITVAQGSGATCARAAIVRWRRAAGPAQSPVFSLDGSTTDAHRIGRVVALLGGDGRSSQPRPRMTARRLHSLTSAMLAPRPCAARDRALLLVAFAGALGTDEARRLRQQDVLSVERGLMLRLPGRSDEWTALPTASEPVLCPAPAWRDWLATMSQEGALGPALPAFPQVAGVVIKRAPLAPQGLNALVQQRCGAIALRGDWSFTSLRVGFIRTALREGAPEHVVARHVGLSALHSVQVHAGRELVISTSVAGRVGL